MAIHDITSIGKRELPVDLDAFFISLVDKGQHLRTQLVDRGNASLEALASNALELNFHYVEPTGRLGHIDELNLLSQSEGFISGQTMCVRNETKKIYATKFLISK